MRAFANAQSFTISTYLLVFQLSSRNLISVKLFCKPLSQIFVYIFARIYLPQSSSVPFHPPLIHSLNKKSEASGPALVFLLLHPARN